MVSPSEALLVILEDVLGDIQKPVSLHEPHFAGQEWLYVKECLDTGWVSSVGSYVDLFEAQLAKSCGVPHAVLTVNGTAALHIALMLAGVKAGEEVLLPALTFIATANAVSYCNAVPHFVDCEQKTFGMNAQKLAAYLAEVGVKKEGGLYNRKTGQRIAAIVPVHIFGHPVDMDALETVAQDFGLPLVSDAAEALGSLYKESPVTSHGLLSVLSFNGNKVVTTGGGGAILTHDPDLARQAKHLTTTAKVPHRWAFDHDKIGYNYRMPNLNAALGCAQLEQLGGFLVAKRALAERYEAAFAGSSHFEFFKEPEFAVSNYWLNALLLKDGIDREFVLKEVHEAGYLCRPAWTLMHELPMYKDCPRMDLSVSENLESRILNLPSSAKLGMGINA